MGFGIWGLGFGVWGLGFGVWGLGFGVWGLGSGIWSLWFGVKELLDLLSADRHACQIPEHHLQGFEIRVQPVWIRDWCLRTRHPV